MPCPLLDTPVAGQDTRYFNPVFEVALESTNDHYTEEILKDLKLISKDGSLATDLDWDFLWARIAKKLIAARGVMERRHAQKGCAN